MTVGWIREGDEEKQYAAQEQVESPHIPILCPVCGSECSTHDELRNHLRLYHPYNQPDFQLDGKSQARKLIVRKSEYAERLKLISTTCCKLSVNGGPWKTLQPTTVRRQFRTQRDSHWDLRLINERGLDGATVESKYTIDFQVPDPSYIKLADSAFLQSFAPPREFNYTSLNQYREMSKCDDPALHYVDAIGDYAIAKLLKENDGNLRDANARMRSALDVLSDFDGVVALAVASCIRFHLNDFLVAGAEESATLLQRGHSHFFRIANNLHTSVTLQQYSALHEDDMGFLIDKSTYKILRACDSIEAGSAHEALQAIRSVTIERLIEQDQAKANVLAAEAYLLLHDFEGARHYLKKLQFNYLFGKWSSGILSDMLGDL